jgi:hypothetical protein
MRYASIHAWKSARSQVEALVEVAMLRFELMDEVHALEPRDGVVQGTDAANVLWQINLGMGWSPRVQSICRMLLLCMRSTANREYRWMKSEHAFPSLRQ